MRDIYPFIQKFEWHFWEELAAGQDFFLPTTVRTFKSSLLLLIIGYSKSCSDVAIKSRSITFISPSDSWTMAAFSNVLFLLAHVAFLSLSAIFVHGRLLHRCWSLVGSYSNSSAHTLVQMPKWKCLNKKSLSFVSWSKNSKYSAAEFGYREKGHLTLLRRSFARMLWLKFSKYSNL